MPNESIGPQEIFVRTTEENEHFAKAAMQTGLFEDTGKKVQSGWIKISVWKLKDGVTIEAPTDNN